jgi:hypothetical protein
LKSLPSRISTFPSSLDFSIKNFDKVKDFSLSKPILD